MVKLRSKARNVVSYSLTGEVPKPNRADKKALFKWATGIGGPYDWPTGACWERLKHHGFVRTGSEAPRHPDITRKGMKMIEKMDKEGKK